MRRHRNPRPRLSKPHPAGNFDIPSNLDHLREIIGRTEALVHATERHFTRFGWRCESADEEEEEERPLEHLAHLLRSAAVAASVAVAVGTMIADELVKRDLRPASRAP